MYPRGHKLRICRCRIKVYSSHGQISCRRDPIERAIWSTCSTPSSFPDRVHLVLENYATSKTQKIESGSCVILATACISSHAHVVEPGGALVRAVIATSKQARFSQQRAGTGNHHLLSSSPLATTSHSALYDQTANAISPAIYPPPALWRYMVQSIAKWIKSTFRSLVPISSSCKPFVGGQFTLWHSDC
jgi:hypothetical protein